MNSVALQYRVAMINVFNKLLRQCIHVIDIDFDLEGSMGYLLRSLGHLVFPDTKQHLLDQAIEQSWTNDATRVHIELDNELAFRCMDQELTDITFSRCIFVQLWEGLHRVAPSRLRAKLDERERLFYVAFAREDGLDWGGLYRDALYRAVDDCFSNRLSLLVPVPNASNAGSMLWDRFIPSSALTTPRAASM